MPEMEQWLAVPGYEGIYEISDQGRIRSLDRIVQHKDLSSTRRKGKLLKPWSSMSGHLTVRLSKGGILESKSVHTLVLEAFVGKRPDGCEARHLNDQPTDNRLSNLKWGTRSENSLDRGRNGIDHNVNKKFCPRGHPLKDANLAPWSLKKNRRECLACSRAKRYCAHKNIKNHLQEVSDRYFKELNMEKAPKTS